jgi:hypothetical protein
MELLTPSLLAPPALALLLVALALVGRRRVDDHPLCRRCGFDLTGAPAGSGRCAECGADLAARRAVRIGHRRRRRGVLLAGSVLLLAAGAPLAMTTAGRLNEVDWARHKPGSWLVREAKGSDAAARDAALAELLRRIDARTIADGGLQALVEHALARQADLTRPWLHTWGRVVERGRATGRVSDEQWSRYLTQAIGPDTVTLTGDDPNQERVVYQITGDHMRLGDGCPDVLVAVRVAEIADWSGLEPGWAGVRPVIFPLHGGGWHVVRYADGAVLAGLPSQDGIAEVRLPIRADFFEVNGPVTRTVIDAAFGLSPKGEPADETTAPASHYHRGTRVFQAATACMPYPSNGRPLRFSPAVTRVHLDPEGRLSAGIAFREPLGDVTFDVFALRGEREHLLGRVTLSAGDRRRTVAGAVPGVAVGDRLRFLFRSPGRLGMVKSGEVVVARRADTPVDRDGAPLTPRGGSVR